MDQATYRRRADECLARVQDWLDDFDPDELDYSAADGVITLEFADGQRYVLNRQAASLQIWFAAGARAWHYRWDEEAGRWVDDRDGHELFGNVAERVSEKLGRPVRIEG